MFCNYGFFIRVFIGSIWSPYSCVGGGTCTTGFFRSGRFWGFSSDCRQKAAIISFVGGVWWYQWADLDQRYQWWYQWADLAVSVVDLADLDQTYITFKWTAH